MSRQGADPAAAAAAELRELIREAHGAVKDLAALLRELRELRAAIPAEAEKFLEDALNVHTGEINSHLDAGIGAVNRLITREEERARVHYQELLGQGGAELILRTCALVLHVSVPTITVEDWVEKFVANAQSHIEDGCSCTGCLTIMHGAGLGGVIDMTSGDLPAGAELVIDTREPG
jgi:hypothetical protein